MQEDKNISVGFDVGRIARTPQEIARDPLLSKARKIELLNTLKHHHAAPRHKGVLRDADLELEKLLELNLLANQN